MWPNPCQGVLSVKVLGLSLGIDYKLVIYDVFGREVYENIALGGGKKWTIDISTFSPGIYIVFCKDKENRIYTGKFIKSMY
jgi:hypothetical protein